MLVCRGSQACLRLGNVPIGLLQLGPALPQAAVNHLRKTGYVSLQHGWLTVPKQARGISIDEGSLLDNPDFTVEVTSRC